eukprot:6456448-Amphidinium_carterae.1
MSRYWLALQAEGATESSWTVAFDGVQCGGSERLTMVANRGDSASGCWLPSQVSLLASREPSHDCECLLFSTQVDASREYARL